MDDPFWQVGVVVNDLAEARHEFTRALGLNFTDPITVELHVLEGNAPVPRTIRVCFSIGHRPCLELIQAGEFPWTADTAGTHHLAIWTADVEKYVADVIAGGGSILTRSVTPEGHPAGFVYVTLASGIRVEVLDEARKPALQQLFGHDVLI